MPTEIQVTCGGNMTKEELIKILQAIREVEQNDATRPLVVLVKTNNLTQEELREALDKINPGMGEVYTGKAPGWAESSYQPV